MSANIAPVQPKTALGYSLILDTDSYKFSHFYPEDTTHIFSYFESRGGPWDTCTLFGLQYLVHEYLSKQVTIAQIDEAEAFSAAHGEPFDRGAWEHVVDKYDGYMPVKIRAIPEGLVVPVSNALMTVECDDPRVLPVVTWLETMLVRLWYPSTIATQSRESKKILKKFLEMSSEDPAGELPFKLHDFGARGVSCLEQSRLGGAAHLLNFMGSDTVEGIRFANHYYDGGMAGFSIPASEHSTVTINGRHGEYKFFEEYVKRYLVNRKVPEGMPKLAACVSDSYDIYAAVDAWTRDPLLSLIKNSGGTLVIRPDSGDPLEVLPKIFTILEENLGSEVRVNKMGFKVLPDYIRVIQGDGIDIKSMEEILHKLTGLKWSASNLAFGSGGGLLQKVNRDTQKWAFKLCAALRSGKWVDVRKDPITDKGKRSKAGRLDLIKTAKGYETVTIPEGIDAHPESVLVTYYDKGQILYNQTLAECRERMAV